MLRQMNTLIIAGFFILSHVSCTPSRWLNRTQLVKESFEPRLYYRNALRDIPVTRDVSYLPEEDYDAENEEKQNRHLRRHSRNMMPEMPDYYNLCETVQKTVEMNNEDYEYYPPLYYEVFCKSYNYSLNDDEQKSKREVEGVQTCVHTIFHCVQRSRTIFFSRRRWESQCWEPYYKEMASGCDCMWPSHRLGDISIHY